MKNKSELRRRKSLCEKSMVLVANIIKLSSVSLGKMSCGTTTTTIRSVQLTVAQSGNEITKVVHSTSTSTAASTKVSLDMEPYWRPRRSQKRQEEPAAVALNNHLQSKPAKVLANIPQTSKTSTVDTTPPSSSLHVKRDRQVLPPDDVDGRAEDFIRRRRQIINDVYTE